MHPLSFFPQLFFLSFVAPMLLRLCVGFFMLYLGKDRVRKTQSWSSFIYIVSGLFLILGLYTQIIAIVSIFVIGFDYYTADGPSSFSVEKKILYFVMKVILLSLLLTGPGFLALDLPL